MLLFRFYFARRHTLQWSEGNEGQPPSRNTRVSRTTPILHTTAFSFLFSLLFFLSPPTPPFPSLSQQHVVVYYCNVLWQLNILWQLKSAHRNRATAHPQLNTTHVGCDIINTTVHYWCSGRALSDSCMQCLKYPLARHIACLWGRDETDQCRNKKEILITS